MKEYEYVVVFSGAEEELSISEIFMGMEHHLEGRCFHSVYRFYWKILFGRRSLTGLQSMGFAWRSELQQWLHTTFMHLENGDASQMFTAWRIPEMGELVGYIKITGSRTGRRHQQRQAGAYAEKGIAAHQCFCTGNPMDLGACRPRS